MLFYLKNLRDYDIEKCVLISFEVKQFSDCKIRLGCGSQHTEFKTCFFFHWPYDFRQSCNFHFFLPEKYRYNDTRYPSILQRERQHTVNIFRTLKNQHNPAS